MFILWTITALLGMTGHFVPALIAAAVATYIGVKRT